MTTYLSIVSLTRCLGGKDINTLSDRCNSIIELEIKKYYGTFISWTDSILNEKSLNQIQNITNTIAPCEKLIFELTMGYDMKKIKEIQSSIKKII